MRRWLCLLALCLAAGLAAFLVLCSRPPLVSEANLRRIEVGMSKSEVEAILGKPTFAFGLYCIPVGTASGPEALTYCDNSLFRQSFDEFIVYLDEDGLVAGCHVNRGGPDKRSLSDRLRDRVAELRASVGW